MKNNKILNVMLLSAMCIGFVACDNNEPIENNTFENNSSTENKDEDKNSEEKENVINDHEYVDLGLPSGLLWATCNVGAEISSDYGELFAWGETKSKKDYSEHTYTYKEHPWILPLKYDAAYVNWGDNWRMPTVKDLTELIENCVWTWTTQNDHNGYKITGVNGNSIFLPAAGYRNGTSLEGTLNKNGHYWLAELKDCTYSSGGYTFHPYCAYYLTFSSSKYYITYAHDAYSADYNYQGRSIRPVCSVK